MRLLRDSNTLARYLGVILNVFVNYGLRYLGNEMSDFEKRAWANCLVKYCFTNNVFYKKKAVGG